MYKVPCMVIAEGKKHTTHRRTFVAAKVFILYVVAQLQARACLKTRLTSHCLGVKLLEGNQGKKRYKVYVLRPFGWRLCYRLTLGALGPIGLKCVASLAIVCVGCPLLAEV